MVADIKTANVKAVQGSKLNISTSMGVSVDITKLTSVDLVADNGMINAFDPVFMS